MARVYYGDTGFGVSDDFARKMQAAILNVISQGQWVWVPVPTSGSHPLDREGGQITELLVGPGVSIRVEYEVSSQAEAEEHLTAWRERFRESFERPQE